MNDEPVYSQTYLSLIQEYVNWERHGVMFFTRDITELIAAVLAPSLHYNGSSCHDDVIKWKHFPRYWPFVRRIHWSPVNSPHKGQWRGASLFSLICTWINSWVNNPEAGDLRRHRAHCDVSVMVLGSFNDTIHQELHSNEVYTDTIIDYTVYS